MTIPASHRLALMHPTGSGRSAVMVAHAPEIVLRQPNTARDATAAIAAAHQDGQAAGRMAAEAAFEMKRQLIETSHREEMQRLVEGAAAALAAKFEEAMSELRVSLADTMADLVRPFIERSVRGEGLDAIIAELRNIIDSATGTTILVQGPHDMLVSIGAAFEGRGHSLKLEASSGAEVRITVDRMLIETRFCEWLKLIEAAQ